LQYFITSLATPARAGMAIKNRIFRGRPSTGQPRGKKPMHEVEFCAQVKSWLDALFASHPEWPFDHAAIEQYGSGSANPDPRA